MTTTDTATDRHTSAGHSAVDRLLAAVTSGRGGDVRPAYAAGAQLDATVPDWRFARRGAAAIAEQYAGWFTCPGRLEELERRPLPDGEVVRYLLAWEEEGVPWAAHHCHWITLDDGGRIVRERFFCGGRWDAALLADMAEAQRAADARRGAADGG